MLLSITSPKLPISRKWAGSAAATPPPPLDIDDVPFAFRLQTHQLTTENIPRVTADGAGEINVNQDYLFDSSTGRWLGVNGMYYFSFSSEWAIYTWGGSMVYYDINGGSGSPGDGTYYESAGGMSPSPNVTNSGVFTRRAALGVYSDQWGSALSRSGDNVMLWRDGFTADNQVIQNNSMFAPSLHWRGDTPVVRFDGVDDYLGGARPDFTGLSVLIAKLSNTRLAVTTGEADQALGLGLDFSANPILRAEDGGSIGSTNPLPEDAFIILTAVNTAGTWHLFVDGVEATLGNLSVSTFKGSPFFIGRDADQWFDVSGLPWNGDMIAVMAYPAEYRAIVEAYQQTLKPV